MKKLFAALRRAPKRTAGLLMVAAAVAVPAALWAWGPDRPTYTYENPAPHVTFNSMVDTPNYGDERNFVRVKEAGAPNNTYTDEFTLEPGNEYTVMVYFHNNAASDLNAAEFDYRGIALDTTMRIQMPGIVKNGERARITGVVSASNATPAEVWDESYGTASKGDVALRYVQNSATIFSNGAIDGQKLPNELFTTGAKLGYDELDGKVPGCNEYAGWVTFNFVVDQPNFEVTKEVSKAGANDYKDSVAVEPGDEIEYKIQYKNTGTTQQDNVFIIDELPEGVEYVAGSTYIANQRTGGQWVRINEDTITERGINIGSYAPGANAYVKFTGRVVINDKLEKCGKNTLVNTAVASTDNGTRRDTATVKVDKDCPPPKPQPKYSCDKLTITKLERTKFEFKTDYTVENASLKHITYVVRNASGAEVYRGTNNMYTQTNPGTYTVQAIVTVTVDGTDKTVTSDKCKGEFTVKEKPVVPPTPEPKPEPEPTPKPTPEVPEELPTTGPAEVVMSLLGIGALVASIGYYSASRRAASSL